MDAGDENAVSSLHERLRASGDDPAALRDALALVTKVAAALARLRRIVPPAGGRWTVDDIEDLVGEFFSRPGRIVDLAIRAKDDGHFKNLIARTLVRVNISTFRKTPLGVLRRRVERRLDGRLDVAEVPPEHWALIAYAGEPHWSGGTEPLQAAAAAVFVAEAKPQAWDSDKRPQATSVASLDDVCTAVLDAAAAPVVKPDVLGVVCERILPAEVDLPVVDENDDEGVEREAKDDRAHLGPGAALARLIWDGLDDGERQLLPDLHTPGRVLESEGVLDLKKTALEGRLERLRAKLGPLLEDFEAQEEAARALLDLHAEWDAVRGTGQNREVEP